MNRFIIRHPVTGQQIYAKRYATLELASKAAKRASWAEDDCTVDVYWCDDTGKPKLCMGYAWHGVYNEIATVSDRED